MNTDQHNTIPASVGQRLRIRFINPNSPLSNITMPDVIGRMTTAVPQRWVPAGLQSLLHARKAIFAPTGLMIAAAVTPRHWHVELVDECTHARPHAPRADVDLVAISAMTTQAKRGYALADEYRRLGVPVVMGGIHPSALPEEALRHCDAVCQGDAESTLPHLLADFEAGRANLPEPQAQALAAPTGTDGQEPRFRHGLRPIYNWAEYPAAPIATPRKDVINPADYLVANPIQTTRGCPHNCNFCTTPAIFGRKFRQRAIPEIVEEMRAVCAGAGGTPGKKPWCFIFADDNFAGNQAWALELCEALKPLHIAWASQCDILISKNDRLLRAMRASGCQGLILGLESPKQDTLREAGKKFVQSDTYVQRIRKIRSAGISLWGAFIFGFDSDTWQDCLGAVRFAERSGLAMSCYPILTPYPGTEFFQQFAREGRLRTRDWERYNGASVVFEPKRMSVKQLRHAQMAAFAEYYSLRSAFRRLGVWPLKGRSWVANLAIWKGIQYYYRRAQRQTPRFRDFHDSDARAWRYGTEAWATDAARRGAGDLRDGLETPDAGPKCIRAAVEELAARAVVASDPLVQIGALHSA